DCSCSKGNVEDKILVPKPPENCARCARRGHLVDGPYCQGCTFLRKKLEEDLNSLNDSPSISINFSHNPPHIDEHCYECGDALDGIFCQQCACKSCGKDYTIAITPVLSIEEPNNSLSIRDKHLDTISTTESDEVIKSSIEDLVPIPSESEGIPDTMCDVHLVNNPTPLEATTHFEIFINSNDNYSSSDEDSLYENIEYVEASPHDSELISLEVEKIVISEDEEIDDDNLHEKLLKVILLITKIKALSDNLTPSSEFLTKSSSTSPKSVVEETNTFDNSFLEFENFYFYLEEIGSGSTTTHSDISLPDLNPEIRENLSSTTCVNLPVEDDHSPLLAYVIWIFLAYLTYPVIPPHLYSFGNEDTIFDLDITINRLYSSKPGLSHRC
nr:hypothetical protein [Tanacetum cinerariifolium]